MKRRQAGVILVSVMASVAVTGCAADEDAGMTIPYRQFSTSPSLGNGQGSPDPHDGDYGALAIFMEHVATGTAALGEDRAVDFALEPGGATFADVEADTYAAAYLAGGSLNGHWGFIYNSVPFGPTFDEMIDFLFEGGGVALVNQIYQERGVDVVAFPVVGSPEQGSGYFQKPVGVPDCPAGDTECEGQAGGIGLRGLCAEPWTLRYLPPAGTVLDVACDAFDEPRGLEFVQAIPGGSAFLTAVQQGTIEGFEFATALDDYDARRGGFFANPESPEGSDGRNVGEVGLRFLHHPGWHQPFYLGWLVIDRSRVWANLDADQRTAIEQAAHAAVVEAFEASSSVQCNALQGIIGINADDPGAAMVLTRWSDEDLARLKEATVEVLDSLGGQGSTDEEVDYRRILDALLAHLGHASAADMVEAWTGPGGSYAPVECVR